MAKKSSNTKKIYLIRPVKGYAYGAGLVHKVPTKLADELLDTGQARLPKKTLPEKLPHRDEFISAGHETLAQIKSIKDLQQVPGIGPAGAKEVREYLEG